MEFKHTPEHLRPLVKPEHLAEVEAHFRDTNEVRQRLEEVLAKKPEWLTEIEKANRQYSKRLEAGILRFSPSFRRKPESRELPK